MDRSIQPTILHSHIGFLIPANRPVVTRFLFINLIPKQYLAGLSRAREMRDPAGEKTYRSSDEPARGRVMTRAVA